MRTRKVRERLQVRNMNADVMKLIQKMEAAVGQTAYGSKLILEIKDLPQKGFELTLASISYWLDEKLYFILGWAKRHEEEGQMDKALQERKEADILQKCIALLPNQETVQTDPGQI